MSFQFVHIANPAEATNHRKQVRVHAAKSTKARRIKASQSLKRVNLPGKHSDADSPAPLSATPKAKNSTSPHTETADEDGPWPLMTLCPPRRVPAPPNPISILSPAARDPFNSFSTPMTPFEGFLLQHFIKYVTLNKLTSQQGCEYEHLIDDAAYTEGTGVVWIQAAAADQGMLAMIFLVACRSLSKLQHSKVYDPIALRYKAICLRQLNAAIAREGTDVSDITITKALALASEEFFSGDKTTADKHLRAVVNMIELRGRPANVGMWKHDDNQHLWSHWAEVLEGWSTDQICLLATLVDEDYHPGDGSAADTCRPYDDHGPSFRPLTLRPKPQTQPEISHSK